MTHEEDVAKLIELGKTTGYDPLDAVWAIFDRRAEIGNELVFNALQSSGLAVPDELASAIPTEMLEVLARLLPANATNSTFDGLLWDLDPDDEED